MNVYTLASCRIYYSYSNNKNIKYRRNTFILHTFEEILKVLQFTYGQIDKNKFKKYVANFHESSSLSKYEKYIDIYHEHRDHINNSDIIILECASLKDKINNCTFTEESIKKLLVQIEQYFPYKKLIITTNINIEIDKSGSKINKRQKLDNIITNICNNKNNITPLLISTYFSTYKDYKLYFKNISHFNEVGHKKFGNIINEIIDSIHSRFEFNTNYVFVINLDKRKDRLENCKKELDKLNISFTRFSGIIVDMDQIKSDPIWSNSYQGINHKKSKKFKRYLQGSLGCKISHYSIIKLAKDRNLPYVIIFEDDLILLDSAKSILNDLKKFKIKNEDWDIIYLGGKIIGKSYENITSHIKHVESVIHMLGYIVNRKIYDIILEYLTKYNIECDNILQYMGKIKKIKVLYCEMVEQTWNDSDIIKGYVQSTDKS